MTSHWHDPASVRHWNDVVVGTTPCRILHFEILRRFFCASPTSPFRVLDVGCGSGRVAEALGDCRPGIEWTGFDDSQAMIDLACMSAFPPARADWRRVDIIGIAAWPFERASFDCALLIQTLHLLEHEEKKRAISRVREHLAPKGVVFVMDRFLLPNAAMFDVYLAAWHTRNSEQPSPIVPPGNYERYAAMPFEAGDRVESIRAHLELFEELGFTAEIVHAYADRALLAARRA